MKKENKHRISDILMDMTRFTPIEVCRKHGIGIQTQNEIKESVVLSFFEEMDENCCFVCKSKLFKNSKSKIKISII
ncbi:MAG: hypothetical protein A3J55_03125 [Candidatus Ryanbacteria bacterium RIFCSPHIGHO2_02_FULL_45_17b]|uniref:Uncharacterized protein n=1 Tax=Candidatus Ryanbacteria bacterium RIFCSPHIGHO2_01_FULL_45_22 TaxID=1802114 RepID=A0A1G2FXN2_9BACT|nr:MAG: hypothetical protein A2719_00100 [Candidatus Ryanbacteria bacterium RIFCSPHIGHO2_01_FULL_45_22]OGZ46539.1 MAG: hypothetical protein A3J55_03125 [Candidatus Ryanbacteria bacterium RIFCSPHIGHO2_02_FULL_45_17b]